MMLKRLNNLGPGLIVSAAFIGPGTVTAASIAGANYGFALLWAIVFSTIATIILQEMSGRLGLVTRQGLGEALRATESPILRLLAIILVIAAILFGNTAFETGNITGAAIGLETLGDISFQIWAAIIGVLAFLLLAFGAYNLIEKVLIVTVSLMGVMFLLTAIVAHPDIGALLKGMVFPSLPVGSLLTVIALIGTTIVPYNLFLHSSSVQQKWPETVPTEVAVAQSRFDTIISISLGGLITLAIATTSAAAFATQGMTISNARTMAQQLEPLLGSAAQYCFGIGLFAAGLSSTITAPLATAYAICGALGWRANFHNSRFRTIWILVLVIGTVLAITGKSPLESILFAQAANGLLLPVVATFLLIVINQADLLGNFRNRASANILGIGVVLIATTLGIFQILKAIGVIAI
ncbi:MAG: Nramp family divalent metal transporter [Pelatocladus maniniholoensis HA4357-MV3]|jgi:manganese transport protein|uniref:Nramp family divalent metal transporter n=1 Tax=Pelatocladus maniniholoensis HA4357-MV3 TaxID=1117104 RepID=A0A9E3LRF8_9NOST|nr:Nramp family divalent metal transporter [Pelatocladus maniniholoensis HA4357-MV3]